MVKIHCRTNLDLNEEWPTSLPERPVVGDRITSIINHNYGHGNINITLEVVGVTWVYNKIMGAGHEVFDWYLIVELHDPLKRSIREFYTWYAPLVGKSVSAFI